jgi:uncharacterized protein with GYD domain
MPTFVLATRVSPQHVDSPSTFARLERRAMDHVRSECPDVEWRASYALLGPHDYLDIIEAPSVESAQRAVTLLRAWGHAHVEAWPATPWASYEEMLGGLSSLEAGSAPRGGEPPRR